MAGFRVGGLWQAIIGAGVIAGVLSTLVQVVLWVMLGDDFPSVLFRDARLAAALVLGSRVLPPPATFDAAVMLAATLIHFALSIVYAALIVVVTVRLAMRPALLAGALCGAALYAINLYGFTQVFPWFVEARSANALAAHVAFGMASVWGYRLLRNGRSGSGAR